MRSGRAWLLAGVGTVSLVAAALTVDAPRVLARAGGAPLVTKIGAAVPVAHAAPDAPANSTCPAAATPLADGVALDTSRAQAAEAGQATACVDGTGVVDGTITAGTGEANLGSVIVDGQPSDPDVLAGYLGTSRQDTLTVVGCARGDYDPSAPDEYSPSPEPHYNNAMASLGKGPLTAPAGPVGPTSPCSPQPYNPGPSGPCGGAQDPSAPPPAATYPATGSPLVVYTSGPGALDPEQYGYVGVAGDFGGNDGASGYIQLTHDAGLSGDIATGGTSKAGGGTVAVGNDGREAGDMFTPPGLPVAVCQN